MPTQQRMTPTGLLVDISACVETQFAEDERPGVCFNGPIPGDGVTALWSGECDNDICGMTWTRIVNAYPASAVGQISQRTGNCSTGLGFDIEVGVLRCTPVGVEDAETEEVNALEDFTAVTDDMLSLRRAISCCTALPESDMILGNWVPMGPMGGLVGGVWTLYAVL